MRWVWVLMENDYPEAVFSNKKAAMGSLEYRYRLDEIAYAETPTRAPERGVYPIPVRSTVYK